MLAQKSISFLSHIINLTISSSTEMLFMSVFRCFDGVLDAVTGELTAHNTLKKHQQTKRPKVVIKTVTTPLLHLLVGMP